MNAPESTTTRPYLIRALHEWCTDNGFTPYVAVRVDDSVQVPREYVNDGEIVLNVGFDATSSLQLGNDYIEFKARFGGKSRDILVPVGRVVAIYARENGQGMAFPPPVDLLPEGTVLDRAEVEQALPESAAADAVRVVQLVSTDPAPEDGDKPRPPTTPGAARPALKRVK
ncbi:MULTISPECIES: ClpXP protease specificity-enhancing factor [unclassified Simplicispira]|jgi:stringent starvation protein B|uniref:ClpXP protease specificity-enhancing factor n=1 Tax=unclassified Simplicispira TaxID=2630407 RepID=UPI000D5CCA9E|nr:MULTISPECIES: ClpXP protease specificity-enhancing factor [unclassified Simplicispira]MBH1979432.1 ClpXP protease specificity-enhancing factor [Comamonadaceae bacterium]PVY56786.1 stringent starvation protein B [Simplicispira sp. 125]REG17731.1 stringent starvation protein B [Simplicispira sp. 110]